MMSLYIINKWKYIFDKNDTIDVFMHSWSTDYEKGLVDVYKPKNYIVDWMSDFVDISLLRDPLNNNVEISIKSAIKSDKQHIKLFYTDLIGVEKEESIYEVLNFDKWQRLMQWKYKGKYLPAF